MEDKEFGNITAENITAKSILIEDNSGIVRICLSMENDVPTLNFYDSYGQIRASFGIFGGGFRTEPKLELYDEKGKIIWSAPKNP